jgi:hypothetical protein
VYSFQWFDEEKDYFWARCGGSHLLIPAIQEAEIGRMKV